VLQKFIGTSVDFSAASEGWTAFVPPLQAEWRNDTTKTKIELPPERIAAVIPLKRDRYKLFDLGGKLFYGLHSKPGTIDLNFYATQSC
jgi:hypothetical protein